MSLLCVRHLRAGYGKAPVIDDLSFTAESGSMVGLLGANGCGKTTLLKALCGILPSEGECLLQGADPRRLNAKKAAQLCGYIPQRTGIQIDISVLEVVLMGFNPHLGLLEQPSAAMRDRARSLLMQVGLSGREETNFQQLSEGQKQLCILARTLAADCRLLLLDEPESALDFRYRAQMLRLVREQVQSGDRCALVALHDPQLALNLCDTLLLIHDARLLAVIHPQKDPLKSMEQHLSVLYGPVTLSICRDKRGKEQIVMLKDEEDTP